MIEKPPEVISLAGKLQSAPVAMIAGRLNATAKKSLGWIIVIGLMPEFLV
jgi:hypothetical protein